MNRFPFEFKSESNWLFRSSGLRPHSTVCVRTHWMQKKLGLKTYRVYYNMTRKESTQPNGAQFFSEILFIVFLRFGDLTCYYCRKFFPVFALSLCLSCQSELFFHRRALWTTTIKSRAIRSNFLSPSTISLPLTGVKKNAIKYAHFSFYLSVIVTNMLQ